MTIDYRAELQRLVQAYDDHGGRWPDHHEQALFQAVETARTTLAQPEPKGVTDEEIYSFIARVWPHSPGAVHDCEWRASMWMMIRAAIEELSLARWGRPANNTRGTH
jgi:hypothetical protein